ncbi:hypothetical protein [Magnetococcus sp. PR-3]|uniref:hypothetical protein n=1 Tax=Magnetococcus sp. PR-3 TaxID=3120355 RepID=UPI002FCE5124
MSHASCISGHYLCVRAADYRFLIPATSVQHVGTRTAQAETSNEMFIQREQEPIELSTHFSQGLAQSGDVALVLFSQNQHVRLYVDEVEGMIPLENCPVYPLPISFFQLTQWFEGIIKQGENLYPLWKTKT